MVAQTTKIERAGLSMVLWAQGSSPKTLSWFRVPT